MKSSTMAKFLGFAIIVAASQVGSTQRPVQGWQDAIVPGATIGEYRHGTFPSWGNNTHVGYDIVAPCGTAVRAWKSGRVVDLVEKKSDPNFNSLGFMVLLDHSVVGANKPEYSIYLHLKEQPKSIERKPLVKGDSVLAGGVIGSVGDTGAAEGCHLHFEARRFAGRFNPTWGNIYGAGDKRADKIFLSDWIDPGRQTAAQTASAAPVYDEVFVDPRGKFVGITRLPPRSYNLLESLTCAGDQLKSVSKLVPKGLKCLAQIDHDGVTFLAFPNWMRTVAEPGAIRLVVAGTRPQALSDIASTPKGFITPILVDGQHVEFLSISPQARYNEKLGHPYLRYRVVGNPGSRQLHLLPTTMFAKGKSPVELSRLAVASGGQPLTTQPPAASTSPASYTGGARQTPTRPATPRAKPESKPAGNYESKEEIACRFAVWQGNVPNVTDLFDCDKARAIATMQTGRRFTLLVGRLNFSGGRVTVWTRQNPSRAKYLQEKLRNGGGGGFWSNFSDRSAIEWYDITCIFTPSASPRLKEGQEIVVFGKLRSANGTNLTFDCS